MAENLKIKQVKKKKKLKSRLLLLTLLNLMLIFSLGLLLSYFKLLPTAWWKDSYMNTTLSGWFSTDKIQQQVSVAKVDKLEYFLLEQEQVEKQKQKLQLKENLLDSREKKLKKLENKYQTILEQLRVKEEQFAQRELKLENRERNWRDREKNVNDLAQKIGDMPPDKASKLLDQIESLLVLDIFTKMDEQAKLKEENSIVPYLMSLMSLKKMQEVVQLKAKFPNELIRSFSSKKTS